MSLEQQIAEILEAHEFADVEFVQPGKVSFWKHDAKRQLSIQHTLPFSMFDVLKFLADARKELVRETSGCSSLVATGKNVRQGSRAYIERN